MTENSSDESRNAERKVAESRPKASDRLCIDASYAKDNSTREPNAKFRGEIFDDSAALEREQIFYQENESQDNDTNEDIEDIFGEFDPNMSKMMRRTKGTARIKAADDHCSSDLTQGEELERDLVIHNLSRDQRRRSEKQLAQGMAYPVSDAEQGRRKNNDAYSFMVLARTIATPGITSQGTQSNGGRTSQEKENTQARIAASGGGFDNRVAGTR